MRLFQRNTAADETSADQARQAEVQAANAGAASAQADAYEQGRRDAAGDRHARVLMKERDAAARQAYDRGRRDERARRPHRRRSPVLTTVLVLAAAAGVFIVYLGVSQGSFSRGGQIVDRNISQATQNAAGAVRNTAGRAGDALENAGQQLKRTGGAG